MNTVAAPQTPFLRAAPDLQRLPPLLRSDKPRLIKDVLRSGKFYVGDDVNGKPQYAVFTDADLEAIAQRFADHQQAGILHSLCWGHNEQGPDVEADKCIATIQHCWAENGTLWFGVYVTDEQAEELTGQHRQTSIGLLRNWRDGTGKVWPGWSMMHAGIVAHAIVPNQHPFLNMAADTSQGTRMTFDVVKTVINMLLAAVKEGTSLPESVSEENFDEMVPAIVDVVLGKEPETVEESEETVEDAPVIDTPPEEMNMSAVMKPLLSAIKELTREVRGQKASRAEDAFRAKAAELAESGVPAGAIQKCLNMGAKNGWNTDVLDLAAASNGTALNMGSQTRKHRKSAPSKPSAVTPDDIREAIEFINGKAKA